MTDLPKCWNEPAFSGTIICEPGQWAQSAPGMTIGQYATIKAMQGLLARESNDELNWNEISSDAVGYARATLFQLERLQDGKA